MPSLELAEVILAVIIGTLAAIVYSLRVLILLERRVAGMEQNIQKMTARVLKEEAIIERALAGRKVSKKSPVRIAKKNRKSSHKSKRRKR